MTKSSPSDSVHFGEKSLPSERGAYGSGKRGERNGDLLILVAAGSSSRLGLGTKKEYLPYNGGTVLSSAARPFLQALDLATIAVTYPYFENPEDDQRAKCACKSALEADGFVEQCGVPVLYVKGGQTRQKSVLNALEALKDWAGGSVGSSLTGASGSDGGAGDCGGAELCGAAGDCGAGTGELAGESVGWNHPLVFIHDGARPFIKSETILLTRNAALENGAAVPGLTPVDTQNEIDSEGRIVRHLVRSSLVAVQTPQVFTFEPLLAAHRRADSENVECTDDTEIWDRYVAGKDVTGGGLATGKLLSSSDSRFKTVKVVAGDSGNKKITYKSDLGELAENGVRKAMIHTGLGYDKHRLVEGRRLMLGGVEIPSEKGEDGHSDGDALLHAITDALLGAAALGDIGSYFPPEEPEWKNADSKKLLAKCWGDVQKAGWKLSNLDCVIALEKPKFLPHRDAVRKSIASVLGVDVSQVFVKAKTGEKTGDVGEGRVVECWVSCLLEKE